MLQWPQSTVQAKKTFTAFQASTYSNTIQIASIDDRG
jgi:hypothetical protein